MKNKTLYLVIRHIHKGNYEDKQAISENVVVTERLKPRDMTEASVVIDILGAKVVKDRFEKASTETFKYYVQQYQHLITKTLVKWGEQAPENMEHLKKTFGEINE